MAADHLAGRLSENGMFVYRTNMNPEVVLSSRYNILRHAGTIYAMAMYNELYPDQRLRSVMLQAGLFLQKQAILPVPGNMSMFAIWSRPEIDQTGAPVQAKLGGTGLGLVALLSIEAIQPGFTPVENLRGLGRFLLHMQKTEGNFYSKLVPSEGGRQDEWESLYYPGEAALGLVMLYEKDPDPLWLEGAVRALTFLARSRRNDAAVPTDHWALLATERLFLLQQPMESKGVRQLLAGHAAQICQSMLDRYEQGRRPLDDRGLFAHDLNVPQIACILEGLLASHAILPADHALRPRIAAIIEEGLTFLLSAQVLEGEYAGAFPRMFPAARTPGENQAARYSRATEVRIDYTQHALSALVRYLKANR